MKWFKNGVFFTLGGGSYVGLELLFRGRSHGSMFAAGGLSFLLLGRLDRKPLPWPVKGLLGAAAVTAVELGTGLVANRDHRVWDYRKQPMNYRGQICACFSALWVPVSLGAMALYRGLDRLWEGKQLQNRPSSAIIK